MNEQPLLEVLKKPYIVRNGEFKGRNLRELSADELRKMVSSIPQDEDAAAGIGLMNWILEKTPPETLIDFVEWGQNILDETGKITAADFSADPDEQPNTTEEKAMLRAARPRVLNRRNLLLVVPSAIIAAFTAIRLGIKVVTPQKVPKNLDDKEHIAPKKGNLEALDETLENYSSTPLETLNMGALLFEVIESFKDYGPTKFDQISNAVAKIADDMGMGEPTPTFRLPRNKVPNVHSR